VPIASEEEVALPRLPAERRDHQPSTMQAPVIARPGDLLTHRLPALPAPFGVDWVNRTLAAVAVWALGMFFSYREVIASGFDHIQGDGGDTRLLIYISEHWLLALKGHQPWRDPGMFYPQTGTLGYSDTLFLYQPVYAPLRLIGLDQFVAYQMTVMALSTVGFVSATWFLYRVCDARWSLALLGGALLTFSNALMIQAGHTQLYAVHLVPLLGLLVAHAVRSIRDRPERAAWSSGAAGLLLASLLFTSFYIGWFVLFAGGIVAVCCGLTAGPVLVRRVRPSRRMWRAGALTMAGGIVGFGIGLVPFAMTYLPVLGELGPRQYKDIMRLMPRATDLLNVGGNNLVWGGLVRTLGIPTGQIANGEGSYATTPFVAMVAVAGTLALVFARRTGPLDVHGRVIAGLLCGGLAVRLVWVNAADISVWRLIRHIVPGAGAIRAVGRLDLAANVILVVAVVLILERALRARESLPARTKLFSGIAIAVLGLLMAAEQIQTKGNISLSTPEQRAMLASVPPVPPPCRVFYVINPPADAIPFVTQLDAMLISTAAGVPTMNGYSGQMPSGWWLEGTTGPNYLANVTAWRQRFALTDGVCSYDLRAQTWQQDVRMIEPLPS
jgi:hypothetical protein